MKPVYQHPQQLIESWSKYDEHIQLIMIANEINRSINSLKIYDVDNCKDSLEKAFELTTFTSEDKEKWNKSKLRELLRYRELLQGVYFKTDKTESLNYSNYIIDLYRIMKNLLLINPTSFNMAWSDSFEKELS